jgi:hypothetical protein
MKNVTWLATVSKKNSNCHKKIVLVKRVGWLAPESKIRLDMFISVEIKLYELRWNHGWKQHNIRLEILLLLWRHINQQTTNKKYNIALINNNVLKLRLIFIKFILFKFNDECIFDVSSKCSLYFLFCDVTVFKILHF